MASTQAKKARFRREHRRQVRQHVVKLRVTRDTLATPFVDFDVEARIDDPSIIVRGLPSERDDHIRYHVTIEEGVVGGSTVPGSCLLQQRLRDIAKHSALRELFGRSVIWKPYGFMGSGTVTYQRMLPGDVSETVTEAVTVTYE